MTVLLTIKKEFACREKYVFYCTNETIPESVIMEPASSSVLQTGFSGGSGQSDENEWSVLKILLHGVEATLFSQSAKFEAITGVMDAGIYKFERKDILFASFCIDM